MSTKFTKPVLAISFLVSLVAMSATANAGATISDKRYWPSEVGPSSYYNTQHASRNAFAAIGPVASPAIAAPRVAGESALRHVGGPKSSVAPSRGF
ncbi:hypothetical protein [Bradyrhizobium sp. USDA 10063]